MTAKEMIKATDLRIGNKVILNGEETTITGIWNQLSDRDDGDGFEYFIQAENKLDYRIELITHIPLSPDILQKCGFKKHGGPWPYYSYEDMRLKTEDGGYEVYASEWTIGKTFYFVHELQNIAYFLFGYELPVNL